MTRLRDLIQFIDEERRRQGLTIRELARRSKLGTTTVSRLLMKQGKTTPELSTIIALAHGLGYDVSSFLAAALGPMEELQGYELYSTYQQLNPQGRELLLDIAKAMLHRQVGGNGNLKPVE
ncbi:MAG: helix-turn-helix transcriptional regulator [Chloroflexi bacterium]|nr:helix-turn-helix transcriptional regulator [Chloroflexota bacterium]